jgi:arylamine N-acetyltransferase
VDRDLTGVTEPDLSGYFARIGYTGPTDPTLPTLTALVAAHGNTIPFENLNPLMGIPVGDLRARTLFDKMVHRRRGGYCYEQNGLLGYVLAELGFDVDALAGRVVWMSPDGLDGPLRPLTHQVLAVRIPGVDGRYLVDVGFGGQTLTSPIRLVTDQVQQTRHEPYRLRDFRGGYVLETLIGDEWRPLYTFTDEPRPRIDLETGSWFVSTHPDSIFVVGLSAALVTDDARWNLRGRNLAVHHSDGHSGQIRLDDAAQVLDELTNRFGIDLDGLGDVAARVDAVLDA